MHLSDGELRAFLDGQLESTETTEVSGHLRDCSSCAARLEVISTSAEKAAGLLGALEPEGGVTLLSTSAARRRLDVRIAEKEGVPMLQKLFGRSYRPVWAAASVMVVLILVLAFPSGRALAGKFLRLFRVQQVQVVSVNPEKVNEQMNKLRSSSELEKLFTNNVQVERQGTREEIPNASEAGRKIGVAVRVPAALEGPAKWVVQPAAKVTLDLDLAKIRAVLAEIGRDDVQLPASLDGEQVTISIPPRAVAFFGECRNPNPENPEESDERAFRWSDCTILVQMLSPTVAAPGGFDLNQVAEAMLQVVGMTQEEAKTFAQSIDWTTTMVIPIPRNVASAEAVSVDGVTGTLITNQFRENSERFTLMWVKDETVYSLVGPGNRDRALEIANSLR